MHQKTTVITTRDNNVITTRPNVISTHTIVIFTRRLRFSHAECDSHTHPSVILTRMSMIMTLTSTITTHSSMIYTRRVQFPHAV
jgi:hypothetical protein